MKISWFEKPFFNPLLAILAAVFLGGLYFMGTYNEEDLAYLSLPQERLTVEIARSEEERVLGLGGRDEIGSAGLLFVFDKEDRYGIWMKDMLFPIDIVWMNSEFKVIHIKEKVSPDTFPRIFYPIGPARYILETAEGFVSKNKIEVGQTLHFSF